MYVERSAHRLAKTSVLLVSARGQVYFPFESEYSSCVGVKHPPNGVEKESEMALGCGMCQVSNCYTTTVGLH